jgi:hypothetical protein
LAFGGGNGALDKLGVKTVAGNGVYGGGGGGGFYTVSTPNSLGGNGGNGFVVLLFPSAENPFLRTTGDILPNLGNTYNIGSSTKRFNTIWVNKINTGAAPA